MCGKEAPEIVRLMFGSFFATLDSLADTIGDPNDSLVHFEGSRNGWDYLLDISPQTPKQAKNCFLAIPSIEQFVPERHVRSVVSEFVERLGQSDCFYFDIDLFRKDVPVDRLAELLSESVQHADHAAEATVARLQSKPLPKAK